MPFKYEAQKNDGRNHVFVRILRNSSFATVKFTFKYEVKIIKFINEQYLLQFPEDTQKERFC